MTGPFKIVKDWQKERIRILTQKGENTSIIAERMALSYQQVRNAQVNMKLLRIKRRKKNV